MTREEKAQTFLTTYHLPNKDDRDQGYHEIMSQYIYGDVYQHGSLSLKLRQLILIVVNTTNHTLTALKDHVQIALRAKVSPSAIKEAVYQCTPYVGYGKVEEALDVVNEVFEAENITLPLPDNKTVTSDSRYQDGLAIQVETFGERMKNNYAQAPQELKHIQAYLSAHCFGDFYTRNGLDKKTRELLTFVMIATLGGCENQLRSHTAGNLALGNDREVLIETITQCQPYIGFPRTLNAINIINEITEGKGK